MSAETEQTSGGFNSLKLVLAIAMIIVGIGGFYYFGNESLLLRVIGLLVALGVAVTLVMMTDTGRGFWQFVQGSQVELRKIVWPTKKETMQTTLIVMVMVLFVGVLLWMFDGLLLWGIGMVTGQGS
ncbi:MAG: preprotein translocase subunit SecE [Piscirickettsiaceae bacterium]|nr:MAG: preprotein translocase subunit SecE [Piscirickettsiaceae bacterium]